MTRFFGKRTQTFDRQSIAKKIAPHREAGKGSDSEKKEPPRLSDLGAVALRKAHDLGLQNGNRKFRGMGATNDFVQDVPLGDFTRLNTVEFKYFGFYERIRQRLEQYWGASLREKAKALNARRRRIASNENYITCLVIIINEQGKITKVHLKGTSGVQELDDAAIESFNNAGPFPNPPKGMLEKGLAEIRWNFIVQS